MAGKQPTPCYPHRVPIDAYGNGGFRFAEMSHRGGLLCLPSGLYAWDAADILDVTASSFQVAFLEADRFEFLLLGTGVKQVFPADDVCAAFADLGLGLEPMSTAAAARTYNVLLAEGRRVAAGLIAVA